MCGIAGIYNFKNHSGVHPEQIKKMDLAMSHRGPDGHGEFISNELGICHRRLSIIDLSERGRQPMATPNGRFHITFNGEVYNYLELSAQLKKQKVAFQSDTDTEVLLHLYAREGQAFLKKLNGMFAFAIWDNIEKGLFIARDRVGIKPLYYAETEEGVVFASEIKALFASGLVKPQVNRAQIDTFMTFGYAPGESTLFKGIKKLLPGYFLTVNQKGMTTNRWWEIEYKPAVGRSVSQTKQELSMLLQDAMRIHMRSDVPVGVFLSGGLDSSTTVAMLAKAGHEQLNTFSVAYDKGTEFDETAYARLVADKFCTKHHQLYLNPEEFVDFIPDYTWYMDEPVTEAAAISLYFISRLLRQHVTVALSGEGADELFAGYDIYRYMHILENYRKAPNILRQPLNSVLRMIGHDKINKYINLSEQPLNERYLGVSLHESWYKELLYTQSFKQALNGNRKISPLNAFYENAPSFDTLSKMLYVDLKSWLVDDLLIKADKMTMANSVELRVPFLDYRVVEYAATIPSSMKRKGANVKWILKQTVQDMLPKEILQRKKVGFPTPLAMMFQTDLADYMYDILISTNSCNRDYFKPEQVKRLIDEHVEKKHDHHKVLWQLVVLEEWHRQFIDGGIKQKQQSLELA